MYTNQIVKFQHQDPEPIPVVEVPPTDPTDLDVDEEILRILIEIQNDPR